jgi:hypothetical protein
VLQNRHFQVVALLAMEPPADREFGAMRSEKGKVFQAMRPLKPDDLVRGQNAGYRKAGTQEAPPNIEKLVLPWPTVKNAPWRLFVRLSQITRRAQGAAG